MDNNLDAFVPTLMSSKNIFGFGVNGAKDRNDTSSDSFLSIFFWGFVFAIGETVTCGCVRMHTMQ